MIEPPSECLAWLRQSAAAGQVPSQLLLGVLSRLDALERQLKELTTPEPTAPVKAASDDDLLATWGAAPNNLQARRRIYQQGRRDEQRAMVQAQEVGR
jgi:hypothetical protein